MQIAQEAAAVAAHVTVFQRTPNLALPMRQKKLDDDIIRRMKEGYPLAYKKRRRSFGGFDYEFLEKAASEVSGRGAASDVRTCLGDRRPCAVGWLVQRLACKRTIEPCRL